MGRVVLMTKKKQTKKPAKRGRPTRYTKALAGRICDRLQNGESLRAICRDEGLAPGTVLNWAAKDTNGFYAQYARARDIGLDARVEEMMDVVENSDDPQRDRLRFDAMRWYTSKLAPKRYGERLEVEHDVSDNLADRLLEARKRVTDGFKND